MAKLNEAVADARKRGLQDNLIRAEMRRLRDARLAQGISWSHDMDELVLMYPNERSAAVQMTYAERLDLDIRTTRPTDISWSEVLRRNHERRKEWQAAKGRADRAARKLKPNGLTARERDLLDLIPKNRRPVAASWLCEQAADVPSFLDKRGRKFSKDTLRQIVHRTLDGLAKANEIVDRIVGGQRGPVRIVEKLP